MEKQKANQIAIIAFAAFAFVGAVAGTIASGVFEGRSNKFENRSIESISTEDDIEDVTEVVMSDEQPQTRATSRSAFERVLDKVIAHDYIDSYELSDLDAEQLRILRNAPYAVAGRRFKDHKLNEFFEQFPWYDGYRSEVSIYELEDADRENITLIQTFEN